MSSIVPAGKRNVQEVSAETQDYVTMYIEGQLFGIPVLTVQDVLGPQRITRTPAGTRVASSRPNASSTLMIAARRSGHANSLALAAP